MKNKEEQKKLNGFVNEAINKKNPVHGMTPMFHRVRYALKLTMEEYAVAHLIFDLENRAKEIIYARFMSYLGMEDIDEINRIIKSLQDKKIIKFIDGVPTVTAAWTELHNENTNEQFEIFWHNSQGRTWPGSKQLAFQRYIEAAKLHDFQYLLDQKKAYFALLNAPGNEFRNTMQASEFLNIKNERFRENWSEQLDELLTRKGVKSTDPKQKVVLTEADKDKLFHD